MLASMLLTLAPSLLQFNSHCHLVLRAHSLSSRVLQMTGESGGKDLPPSPVTRDNSSTTFLSLYVHWVKLFPASNGVQGALGFRE